MKRSNFGILVGCLLLSQVNADEQAVRQSLARSMPTVQPDLVAPSEVKGLYEVMIGANIFYMSDDGKYILQGKLFDVEGRRDLSEEKLAGARIKALNEAGSEMVVFTPKESKYKVSIFTDIDCGYCRKLHAEIDQYKDAGITVQYLFFPRAGKGSDSYNKAVSVWCSKDRNKALTSAKKGESLEAIECENPVDEHLALGRELGVAGTPMIVTEQGAVLPGYVPAEQLSKVLSAEKTGM